MKLLCHPSQCRSLTHSEPEAGGVVREREGHSQYYSVHIITTGSKAATLSRQEANHDNKRKNLTEKEILVVAVKLNEKPL